MDFSTSSLCVKWKKTASRCWCSRIFLLDLQPRCWNLHTAFQLIWDYPLLAPALVSAPATRTSLDANLFKNWNLGGDWNIWFFTQPIIALVLFFQQTFPPRPIEFSWTLVAPHSLKNSSLLVILLSVLFFLGCCLLLCSHFLHCNAKGQGWRMDGSKMGFPFGLKQCLQFSLDFVSPPFGRFDNYLYAACCLSQQKWGLLSLTLTKHNAFKVLCIA